MRLYDEFRAIPWNARGRRVGRIIEGVVVVAALTAPGWVEGVVFRVVGR